MLKCRQVAKALADRRYWELPLLTRIALRTHVLLCFVCGRYHRQVLLMQDVARHYIEHEQVDPPPPAMVLSPAGRERILSAVQKGV